MQSVSIRKELPPFPGFLYVPDSEGPHPGILLLHGSEGGHGDFWTQPGEEPLPTGENTYVANKAKHLASLGFAAYAFSYFHADDIKGFKSYPPKELANIEMEKTSQALQWLKNSRFVQDHKVGLWGGSRGAEHALIFASHLSQLSQHHLMLDAIIANAPSDFIYPGLSLAAAQALSADLPFPTNFPSAWSLNSKPLEMFSPISIEKLAHHF